jgi:hypothetical protein
LLGSWEGRELRWRIMTALQIKLDDAVIARKALLYS